jgi:hypothetical protein
MQWARTIGQDTLFINIGFEKVYDKIDCPCNPGMMQRIGIGEVSFQQTILTSQPPFLQKQVELGFSGTSNKVHITKIISLYIISILW